MDKVKKTAKKELAEKPKRKRALKPKKQAVVLAQEKPTISEAIPAPKAAPETAAKSVKYFEGIGRRKTAVAIVRLLNQGEKTFLVNGKPYQQYFPTLELQEIVMSPLRKMNCEDKFGLSVKVLGGGIHAQAEAMRHGIARALVISNAEFRKRMRRAGYLTRDPRMRERKKFGLKRARRAPQWQKR